MPQAPEQAAAWKMPCGCIEPVLLRWNVSSCSAAYCDLSPEQHETYRRVYAEAVTKWPHLKAEIVGGADFGELLA